MITMEQVNHKKAKLAEIEKRLMNLEKIEKLDKILTDGLFMVDVTKVEGAFTNAPIHLSLILTDAEQSVLSKGIQVVLEFARQRIEKEIDNV